MTILGGPPCFIDGMPPADGNGGGGCSDYGFYAWRDWNQNLGLIEVLLDWNNKLGTEAPAGFMDLATDTATVPASGRYTITSGIEVSVAARGVVHLRCYINGTYNGSSSDAISTAGTVTPNYALTKWLAAGTTVQMRAYQNTGFAATIQGCCDQLWFSMSGHCIP